MRTVRSHEPGPDAAQAELIGRAVTAFARGGKELLRARLEAGLWCHRYYAARLAAGCADRARSSKFLAAKLLPFAESKRDANPASLARLYNVARLLGGLAEDMVTSGSALPGEGLTLTKLDALSPLVLRPEGTESYQFFSDDAVKQEAARALWDAACATGAARVGLGDLRQRVQALRDGDDGDPDDGGADTAEADVAAPAEGPNPTDQRGRVEGNLLTAASRSAPQDLAELLAGALARHEQRDDVLGRLLALLAADTHLAPRSRSACKRALLILRSGDGRHDAEGERPPLSPAEVAARLANAGKSGALLATA